MMKKKRQLKRRTPKRDEIVELNVKEIVVNNNTIMHKSNKRNQKRTERHLISLQFLFVMVKGMVWETDMFSDIAFFIVILILSLKIKHVLRILN